MFAFLGPDRISFGLLLDSFSVHLLPFLRLSHITHLSYTFSPHLL